MESKYIEFIQDVLISVHENLHELTDRKGFAEVDELTYIDAKITAYQEVLFILHASAEACGLPKGEIGL